MFVLKAETRNTNLKPKQLRREGIIPGVLYGKDLEESLSIQFHQKDAESFLKSGFAGKKIELELGGKKFSALLKETAYEPATSKLLHLSFQTLRDDEPVTSTMKVVLLNSSKVRGVVQLPHPEISYKALPAHLTDTVEIDLEGAKVGDTIKISELDVANNPNIEILDDADTVVLTIIEGRVTVEETEESDEDGGDVKQESAEA